jgi:hypothetical protein
MLSLKHTQPVKGQRLPGQSGQYLSGKLTPMISHQCLRFFCSRTSM